MKTYDPSEPLIGLHIPKTGGSSLLAVLQGWFPEGRLVQHYRVANGLPERHALTGGTCAYGHFNAMRGFGVRDYYPDVRQLFCFVREPFDRVLSMWCYANRRQASGDERRTLADHPSFEAWLKRMVDQEVAKTNERCMVAHVLGVGSGVIDEVLENEFVFVGTMERFAESVDCLADILGKPRSVLGHVNKAVRTETDLEKWRPFYEEHFSRDMELYSAACRINADMLDAFNRGEASRR